MNKKTLLKHLVFLMFFIFFADFLAGKFYWYSLISYFDIIMHFLSGFWVGLFFIYVFSDKKNVFWGLKKFLIIVFATLIVGLLWELYEFYLNFISSTSFFMGDTSDTLLDLFYDTLGAVVSFFYASKFIMNFKNDKL